MMVLLFLSSLAICVEEHIQGAYPTISAAAMHRGDEMVPRCCFPAGSAQGKVDRGERPALSMKEVRRGRQTLVLSHSCGQF